MKNKSYLFIALITLLDVFSCKKDAQTTQQTVAQQASSLEKGIINFSINGELLYPTIDTTFNTIVITMPDSVNTRNLMVKFTLAGKTIATVNNTAISNSFVSDFSKPVNFTLTSADKKRSITFQVFVQTELQYYGLTGNLIAAKSLNKNYSFYYDQFDGSAFQSINCGPAVTTMAIKWADSGFTKKPAYARTAVQPHGDWWTTGDVQSYLSQNQISSVTDTIVNIDSLVKTSIDNNNTIILCLDMSYVPFNALDYQHTQKFYTATSVGWGHFLFVKGYEQLDNKSFYLEIYDPYSNGRHYSAIDVNQPKGKDRYYLSDDIKTAINNWWPYAIIVAPKGQKAIATTKGRSFTIKKAAPLAFGK